MDSKTKFFKELGSKSWADLSTYLLQLLAPQSSNSTNSSKSCKLADILDYFGDKDHQELWKILEEKTSNIINELQNLGALESDDCDESVEFNSADNEIIANFISLLIHVSKIHSIHAEKFSIAMISKRDDVLQSLHDILLPLSDKFSRAIELKSQIAKQCELKWQTNCVDCGNYVTQLLPYLLLSSLAPSSTDSDIKRVFQLRKAILMFDFDDSSIESLRGLLLRCLLHPAYLKLSEGRRVLSLLLTINEGNMRELALEVVKPQISHGNRIVCMAYGDIFVRAWKCDSLEDQSEAQLVIIKGQIEECLQTLIFEAIHTSNRNQFKGLRLVLSNFHDLKRQKEVDSLLTRIYSPIIWRSLKAANAIIRSQASIFFFDIFPLQDASHNQQEAELLLQKQFDLLVSLLQDCDHRVRVAAASGSCHILREYWEAVPADIIKKTLSYLVGTLAYDTSDASVRLAVISGLKEILDQPLSHIIMGNILPNISNLLHDNAEKVRLGFIELLIKVKGLRTIHFYDIVSVEQILDRLAEDANRQKISLAITELLLNSFYPQSDGTAEQDALNQGERCLSFIRENVRAAEVFYSHLHQVTKVGSAVKISVMLFSQFASNEENAENVVKPVENRRKKATAEKSRPTAPDSSFQFPDSLQDSAMRIGVLRVLLATLLSIESKLMLPKYSSSLLLLNKHFTSAKMDFVLSMFAFNQNLSPLSPVETSLIMQVFAIPIRLAKISSVATSSLSSLSFDVVIENFIVQSQLVNKVNVNGFISHNALVVVELVQAMDKWDELTTAIESSFATFASKSRKSNSTVLPFYLAVELLCLMMSKADESKGSSLFELLQLSIPIVLSELEESNSQLSEVEVKGITRLISLWFAKALLLPSCDFQDAISSICNYKSRKQYVLKLDVVLSLLLVATDFIAASSYNTQSGSIGDCIAILIESINNMLSATSLAVEVQEKILQVLFRLSVTMLKYQASSECEVRISILDTIKSLIDSSSKTKSITGENLRTLQRLAKHCEKTSMPEIRSHELFNHLITS